MFSAMRWDERLSKDGRQRIVSAVKNSWVSCTGWLLGLGWRELVLDKKAGETR
jgi:hypothetical protein